MMQPFFIRTRATMMSLPTTNCRCSSGFKSSRSIEDQGMYFNSILIAGLFFTAARRAFARQASACWAGLPFAVLPLSDLVLLRFLVVPCAFAISVYPAFIDCNGVVVQVA